MTLPPVRSTNGPPATRHLVGLWLFALMLTAAVPQPAAGQDDPLADYNAAVAFFKQQQWDLAARTAATFLDRYPDHPKAPLAMLYRGQSLAQLSRNEPARTVFRQFLVKYPNHPRALLARYRIGEASHLLGEDDVAVGDLRAYLAGEPTGELVSYARLYLGQSLVALGRSEDALAPLGELLRDNAAPAAVRTQAKVAAATAMAQLGKTDQAVPLLQEAIAKLPSSQVAAAQFQLGRILFDAERYADAQTAFDVAGRDGSGPLKPLAALNGGIAAYRAEQYDAAIDRFVTAAESPDQQAAAAYWTGLSQKASGKPELAAETLLAAFAQTPQDALAPQMLFRAAESLAESNQPRPALDRYIELVEAFPQDPLADDAINRATTLAIQQDRLDDAATLDGIFADRYPDSPLRNSQTVLSARLKLARAGNDELTAEQAAPIEGDLRAVLAAEPAPSGNVEAVARVLLARVLQRRGRTDEIVPALRPLVEPEGSPIQTTAEVLSEARLLAAAQYVDQGEATKAATLLRPLADDPTASLLLAEAEAMLGDADAAESAMQRAATTAEARRRATWERLGTTADAAGDSTLAARWFARGVDLIDDRTDANEQIALRSGLGYALIAEERHDDAAAALESLLPLAEGNETLLARTLYAAAVSRQKAGDVAEAAALYRRGIERFAGPGRPLAAESDDAARETVRTGYRLAKGGARLAKDADQTDQADRDYAAAAAQLRRLPAGDAVRGDLAPLLYEWGLGLRNAERYDRADAVFAALVEEIPDSDLADDAAMFVAENAYFRYLDGLDPKPDDAIGQLSSLTTQDTASAAVRERAAGLLLDLLIDTGQWASVLATAERFADQFPESSDGLYARYARGKALLNLGRLDAAAATLDGLTAAATSEDEWADEATLLQVEALVRDRRYDEATAVADAFAEARPDSSIVPALDEAIGRALKNQAEFDAARERLTRVLVAPAARRTETAAKAQLLLADIDLLQEKWEDALTGYIKVYANYAMPEYQSAALLQVAKTYESRSRFADAARTYQSLLSEFPDSPYAAEASERLPIVRQRAGLK